jgi:hypothetical protein
LTPYNSKINIIDINDSYPEVSPPPLPPTTSTTTTTTAPPTTTTTSTTTAAPLAMSVILKPMMKMTMVGSFDPSLTGGYDFKWEGDTGFINTYALLSSYTSPNRFLFMPRQTWVTSGHISGVTIATESSASAMTAKSIPFSGTVTSVSGGIMLVWQQEDDIYHAGIATVWEDVHGNAATQCPFFILAANTNTVLGYKQCNITATQVSATSSTVTIRLTRTPDIGSPTFSPALTPTMSWLNTATLGSPDPLDPTNPNKTIITVGAGVYSVGVLAKYFDGAIEYPESIQTMVLEIR